MSNQDKIQESKELEKKINEKYFILSEEGFPIVNARYEDPTPPPVRELNVRDPEKIENMNTFWSATVYSHNIYLRAVYLALRGDISEALDLEKKWENRIKECYPEAPFDSSVPFGKMEAAWILQGRFNSKLTFDKWTLKRERAYFCCSQQYTGSLGTTALKATLYYLTGRRTDRLMALEKYMDLWVHPNNALYYNSTLDEFLHLGTFYALFKKRDKLKLFDSILDEVWLTKLIGLNKIIFTNTDDETLPSGIVRKKEIYHTKKTCLTRKTIEKKLTYRYVEGKDRDFYSSQVFSWQIFLSARGEKSSHIYDRWKSIGGLNKDGFPYTMLEKSSAGGFTLPFGMDKKPKKQYFFAKNFYLMLIANLVSKKGF